MNNEKLLMTVTNKSEDFLLDSVAQHVSSLFIGVSSLLKTLLMTITDKSVGFYLFQLYSWHTMSNYIRLTEAMGRIEL